LEALYEIKPVGRGQRVAFQKAGRSPPSAQRLLLQCLIAQPELGKQTPDHMSEQWHGHGADAEAVLAVLMVLRETDFTLSSPTLTQLFQGTAHEKILATAQTDMLMWGENFDVAAEFAGLIGKFQEEQHRQQLQSLLAGGLKTDPEREQYRLLQNQMRARKS
jgi:hypothetical protein